MNGRLTSPDVAGMTRQQRELHERLITGPRAAPTNVPLAAGGGPVIGPAIVWLARPPLGLALERLGAAVRFESLFTARQLRVFRIAPPSHLSMSLPSDGPRIALRRGRYGAPPGNFGGWRPFTAAELKARYGTVDQFVAAYTKVLDGVIRQGYVLQADRAGILSDIRTRFNAAV